MASLSFVHPLELGNDSLPDSFTYPFRYTPHPLCIRAAALVQQELLRMDMHEGKMYGVLVAQASPTTLSGYPPGTLCFLAAYSGQLNGSYAHPWFVPPIVDYLAPDSHFQREQTAIMDIGVQISDLKTSPEHSEWQRRVLILNQERERAVCEAKQAYAEGKSRRELQRATATGLLPQLIRESQQQKADIHRAKQLHKQEIEALEARLAAHNATIRRLFDERKRRSESLQQWLFQQFTFLDASGQSRNLGEIFAGAQIPSGAGECCAPKLLQTAYLLNMKPLAMAEFWWGDSKPGHYREPGAFFPACRSKCHPILGHMLRGLNVEPDPAAHYDTKQLHPIRFVWEDKYLAVVVKPDGWVSIPGKSDQPCLLDEILRLRPEAKGSIIVHRLDQDTSGLMVIAKSAAIHRALSQQFEQRVVEKRYTALLESSDLQRPAHFTLSVPLGPDLENQPRQQVDYDHGKEATTLCELLGTEIKDGREVTRVAFRPKTGRTHQLRVHAASPEGLSAPIVGDRLYGTPADRMYLHADLLEFRHPITREWMHFEDPAPF